MPQANMRSSKCSAAANPSVRALAEAASRICDAVKSTADKVKLISCLDHNGCAVRSLLPVQYYALREDMLALNAALEPPACTQQQLAQVPASVTADIADTVMLGLSILSQTSAGSSV
jgi:hypothetical protein